jgi:hypothetical protein
VAGAEWEDAPVITRARPWRPNRSQGILQAVLGRRKARAKTVMVCPSCELTGGPFAPGEAALLLAVHEQMHHGGVSMHRPSLPPAP